MKKGYAGIIIGIAIGLLVTFSPGSLFMLILTILAITLICRIQDRRERNFLLFIFLGGLAVRIILALFLTNAAFFTGRVLDYSLRGCPGYVAPYIFDDSGYYTLRSWFTSMQWSGLPLNDFALRGIVKNTYGFSGFSYILALFFKTFGYSPVSSRFINSFLGASSGILVYFTLKNILNERAARIAAALTTFFPSLVLWSVTNLKETSVMFAACSMIFFLVRFQKTKRAYCLIPALMSLLFSSFIRSHSHGVEFGVVSGLIIAAYISYLWLCRLPLKKRIALLALIFIGCAIIAFSKAEGANLFAKEALQRVLIQHKGAVLNSGLHYRLLPDEYYMNTIELKPADALMMLFKGWFHIGMEPLPWQFQSKSMMASFPQMLIVYYLIPFAVLGIWILVRYRFKECAALIAYFIIMTSVMAMAGGNIGTVFRQRDVNTPFFLMLSSVGLVSVFKGFSDKNKEEEE